MIRIEELSKSYGSKEVFNSFTCNFEKRGIYVLRGANGVGKSTLLNIIAGLIKYNKGKIYYYDQDFKLKTGFILNTPLYESELTLLDNCKFQGHLRGMKENEIVERCIKYSELLNVPIKEKINSFSDGMKKKTSIILSLINNPSYIVWDEPFTNLDSKSIDIIVEGIIPSIQWGIISTHNNYLKKFQVISL